VKQTKIPPELNPIEAIIRPIITGQLKSFISDHPEALSKRWISSIEKRITNDLLSRGAVLRLREAFRGYECSAVASHSALPWSEADGDRRGSQAAPFPEFTIGPKWSK